MSKAQGAVYEVNTLANPETLKLVRAYYRIKSDKVRERLFELVKTVAKVRE